MTAAARVMGIAKPETSLFDGKTLDGWIQVENSATSLTGDAITDPAGFVRKLMEARNGVSQFLREPVKADLADYSSTNAKAAISRLVKDLNQVIAGASIYDRARFQNVTLRPETRQLLERHPHDFELQRLNKMLLEDAFPDELAKSSLTGWTVKDGAMVSMGTGRGVIYTARDFGRYRLTFTMRHVSGNPDHQACVLIFCKRPQPGEKPLDALGGIQLQPPNGGHWDYRPGMNNNGGGEFASLTQTGNKNRFDVHAWSRVEILADAATGTARMSVAQPPGSQFVQVLEFKDPSAGKPGPIAWQMHNAGLFDEYKDVAIELDPT